MLRLIHDSQNAPLWMMNRAGAVAEQPVGGAQSHRRPRLRDAGVQHARLHGGLRRCSGFFG